MSSVRVAYVTTYDAHNIRSWSGLGYYIARCLEEQGFVLDYVDSLAEAYAFPLKVKQGLYKLFLRKRYIWQRDPVVQRGYARQVLRSLSSRHVHVIFSPTTLPIAALETETPIAFWTDATFAGMLDFYPEFTNLSRETIAHGHELERAALERCSLALYASEWAAQSAITHYGVNPSKVKVVPFGANINGERSLTVVRSIIDSRPRSRCKLLFLGVDWFRKGGDVALAVANELNRAGLPTELTIAGCKPILRAALPSYVRPVGFINKATARGAQQIDQLLAEAHFLILPSRAEAFGVVFCEASSFGVPCLATNIGGIPTAVRDGVNGHLFPVNASAEYCTYISKIFSDYDQYKALALSSFHEYTQRLNWQASGQRVKELLLEVVK